MRADLHIHTTASDGSWSVDKLIQELASAGIGLFSVTDHDSIANVAAAGGLAKQAGLSFIPGVEICTTLKGQSFHILGYGIDPEAKALAQILEHNTSLMEEVDHASIKKLIADGLAIDYDEYCSYRHDPSRGCFHIMQPKITITAQPGAKLLLGKRPGHTVHLLKLG